MSIERGNVVGAQAFNPQVVTPKSLLTDPAAQKPNPKDNEGRKKLPLSLWPASATAVGCLGLLEGQLKYGRTNWRVAPVFASVYIDALLRHVSLYTEGENLSSDSANLHLGNALACLAILVDATAHGTLVDDRNYTPTGDGMHTAALFERLKPMVAQLQQQFAGYSVRQYSMMDMDNSYNPIAQPNMAKNGSVRGEEHF